MSYFLMEFNRDDASRILTRFENSQAALAALREHEAARRPEVEVVLLMAESEVQLRRTHGRYFMTIREMAQRMTEEILASARQPLATA